MIPDLARSVNGAHSAYAITAFKVAVTAAACSLAMSVCFLLASFSAATKCLSSNCTKHHNINDSSGKELVLRFAAKELVMRFAADTYSV